jgi:flagellar hook assembly protein FlgD
VFVGTGGGLVSYMSDATEPKEDFSTLYAYPNPVAANYYGYITIVGAMENTEVRIVDTGGNLVQTIKCTGGSAAWDGTNTQGKRVASGVYTALCNTTDGNGHGVVKILVMN